MKKSIVIMETACLILEVQTKRIDPIRLSYALGQLLNHGLSSQATLVLFRPLKLESKRWVDLLLPETCSPVRSYPGIMVPH